MKRILVSLGMLTFLGAIIWGATGAFFSDSETSTGNVFAAGDIDLQIDNESYVTNATGTLVFNPGTSWSLKDLVPGVDHFFNFEDLKPGDLGEDTISIHVGSNSAWMCAAARITSDLDNSITEPEDESDGDLDNADATPDGDLDSAVNFAFWHDDGDNVFETGEGTTTASTTEGGIFLSGPLSGLDDEGQITLADSEGSILGGNTPIPGDTTFYIGKAWCYGDLTPDPVAQDGLGKTGNNGPLARGTGFDCDGSEVGNEGQTDSVEGDLQFYAVQSRNNTTFTCDQDYIPTWGTPTSTPTTTLTVKKIIVPGNDQTPPATTTFSFAVDGGANVPFEADGTNVLVVSTGPHSVVETVKDPDYTATYTNTDNANLNCTALTGPVTCTITNTFGSTTATSSPPGAGLVVGAVLADYAAPACDVTASTTDSIQALEDAAAPDDTICVDTTYTGIGDNTAIRIEKSGITLAATVRGVNLDVPVVLSASNVTVTGFDGVIGQAATPSELAAFYVEADGDLFEISFNTVVGGTGVGILTETGGALGGGLIANNVIDGASGAGIYTNPHTGVFVIEFNDIDNNGAGIGGLMGATVRNNEFAHTIAGSEAIGIDETFDANPTAVNFNNFLNGTEINTYNTGLPGTITSTIDAEDNFFSTSGAAQTDNSGGGTIDFTPETNPAYPHNS